MQREPVNIGQNRLYNQDKMNKEFGWRKGYYQTYFDKTGLLAPNIAIYCKTPVFYRSISYPEAHILNVIGLAFDNYDQPDYKYFFKTGMENVSEKTKKEIINFYDRIFHMIYFVARRLNLSTVVMSAFGANNFADRYPGGGPPKFKENIFFPTFLKQMKKNNDITTVTMGMKSSDIYSFIESKGVKIKDVGFFPNFLNEKDFSPEKSLIINAWDPFSIVGNGNEMDFSLDGFIGRATACSMLCWPYYNKKTKYIPLVD